jgi:hypothetical protein
VYQLHLYDQDGRHLTTSSFVRLTKIADELRPFGRGAGYDTLRTRLRDGKRFRVGTWLARLELVPLDKFRPPT